MTWNWFFSSTAQAVAAVVGLFGAFLISRILQYENDVFSNTFRMRQTFEKAKHARLEADSMNTELQRHIDRTVVNALNQVDREARTKVITDPPGTIYEKLPISVFADRISITAQIGETLSKANATRSHTVPTAPSFNPWRELDWSDEEEFLQHYNSVQEIAQTAEQLHSMSTASKTFFRWVLIAVGVLYTVGVLLPLSLLPVHEQLGFNITLRGILAETLHFKGITLIIVSGVFYILLVTFWKRLNRIMYPDHLIGKMMLVSDLGYYSPLYHIGFINISLNTTGKAT
ncbi:MAG: hypothetical protein KAW14_03300 [Candidatus Aegiribacteria sp.]|nr:hypothetical protein [Candidatus Aegiribacteria sp.]